MGFTLPRHTIHIVCAIHLALCIWVIVALGGDENIYIGGLLVTPTARILNAMFYLANIVVIVYAGVGALYSIEENLTHYFLTLVASLILTIVWMWMVYSQNVSCSSVTCTIQYGAFVSILVLCIIFQVIALTVVWKERRKIQRRSSRELIPFIRRTPIEEYDHNEKLVL